MIICIDFAVDHFLNTPKNFAYAFASGYGYISLLTSCHFQSLHNVASLTIRMKSSTLRFCAYRAFYSFSVKSDANLLIFPYSFLLSPRRRNPSPPRNGRAAASFRVWRHRPNYVEGRFHCRSIFSLWESRVTFTYRTPLFVRSPRKRKGRDSENVRLFLFVRRMCFYDYPPFCFFYLLRVRGFLFFSILSSTFIVNRFTY